LDRRNRLSVIRDAAVTVDVRRARVLPGLERNAARVGAAKLEQAERRRLQLPRDPADRSLQAGAHGDLAPILVQQRMVEDAGAVSGAKAADQPHVKRRGVDTAVVGESLRRAAPHRRHHLEQLLRARRDAAGPRAEAAAATGAPGPHAIAALGTRAGRSRAPLTLARA